LHLSRASAGGDRRGSVSRLASRSLTARGASPRGPLPFIQLEPSLPLSVPTMKTNKNPLLTAASISALSATVLLSACSRDNSAADSAAETASTTETEMKSTMNAATTAMADSWDDLKDYSYD